VKQYNVLKSTDGAHFEKIGTVAALDAGSAEQSYKFTDVDPVAGLNYYRIQSEDKDGKVLYSSIVKVDMAGIGGMIKLYNNPVTDNTVKLSLANMEKGNYMVRLLNSAGQLIKVDRLVHPGGSAIYTVKTDKLLAKGLYHVEINKPGTRTISLKVSVE
jgi:hypothetical protein